MRSHLVPVWVSVTAVVAGSLWLPTPAVAAPAQPGADIKADAPVSQTRGSRDSFERTAVKLAKGSVAAEKHALSVSSQAADQVHPPALGVTCVQSGHGRPGGLVVVTCSVPRTDSGSATRTVDDVTGPGAGVRRAVLQLRATGGVSIIRASGPQWSCRSGKTVTCRRPAVARSASGEAIRLTARLPKEPRRTVGIAADLAWREQRLRTGTRGVVTAAGWRSRRTGATAALQVGPRLTVTAEHLSPDRVAVGSTAPAGARAMVLRAQVGGIGGEEVGLRWRQVSGPRATFVAGESLDAATAISDARVQLPDVERAADACFVVRVTGAGVADSARTCVRMEPLDVVSYSPRVDSLDKSLGNATGPVTLPEDADLRGLRVTPVRAVISGRGPTSVTPGRPVRLSADVTGAEVRSITWKAPPGVLVDDRARGDHITFTPPPLSGGTAVVTAQVTLAGGRVITAGEILVQDASRAGVQASDRSDRRLAFGGFGVARLGRPPAASQARATALGTAEETFCDLVAELGQGKGSLIELGDGTQITVPADAQRPQDCRQRDAKIAFTGAQVTNGEISFAKVRGSITATGLDLAGGQWILPTQWKGAAEEWGKDLPPAVKDTFLTSWSRIGVQIDLPSRAEDGFDTILGAEIDEDGSWRGMHGGFTVPSLSMLPLPDGWSWEPRARLTFEPQTSLITLQQTATGKSGQTLTVTGRVSTTGDMVLKVTVAGVELISNDRGTLTGSGTGQVTMLSDVEYAGSGPEPQRSTVTTFSGAASVSLRGQGRGNKSDGFEVFDGLRLRNASIAWSNKGIRADAGVQVNTHKDTWMDLAATGQYESSDRWSLDLKTTKSWNLTDTLAITRLGGTLTRTTRDSASVYEVTVGGSVSGRASRSVRLDNAAADITNACPTGERKKKIFGDGPCSPGTIRMLVTGKAFLTLPDQGEVQTSIAGWFNFTDGKFRTSLEWNAVDPRNAPGPKELKLRKLQVTASNVPGPQTTTGGATINCAVTAGADTNVGFTAEATVLGKDVQVTGVYDGSVNGGKGGYCLVGSMPSDIDVGKGVTVGKVYVAYSSFDTRIQVTDPISQVSTTKPLPAGTVKLGGRLKLPAAITGEMPAESAGAFGQEVALDASLAIGTGDKVGFTGTASYSVRPAVNLVSTDTTRLSLTTATLSISTTSGLSLAIGARGELSIADKATPLAAELAIALDKGVSIQFAGWVDPRGTDASGRPLPTYVDKNGKSQPYVADAFGQAGLDIRQLRIGFGLSATDFSVSLGADVTLPEEWTSQVRISQATPIELAMQFSSTAAPCLAFSIGESDPAKRKVALDIAGQGVLTARYAKLVYAPQGCTYRDQDNVERKLAAGYELAFDGEIAGTPVKLQAKLGMPTAQDRNLTVKADLFVGDFSLGGMAKVQQTTANIDIDTRASRYIFGFKGGIQIGESDRNRVDVDLRFAKVGSNVRVFAEAQASLEFSGFTLACLNDGPNKGIKIDLQSSNGVIDRFEIALNCKLRVLGAEFGLAGNVSYSDGQVKKLWLQARVSFDLVVARVEDATLEVQYERQQGQKFFLQIRTWGKYWVPLLGQKSFDLTIVKVGDSSSKAIEYQPAPPVSTVGNPPYRWIAGQAGCLEPGNYRSDGSVRGALRCADLSYTKSGSRITSNAWVTNCRGGEWVKPRNSSGRWRYTKPCPAPQIRDHVVWKPTSTDPNRPALVERRTVLRDPVQLDVTWLRTYAPKSGVLRLQDSNLCLTAAGTSDGSALELQECSPERAEQRVGAISSQGVVGDAVTIAGGCLDIPNEGPADIGAIRYSCNGSMAQRFTFTPPKSRLNWAGGDGCLAPRGGSLTAGTPVALASCVGPATAWQFVATGNPYGTADMRTYHERMPDTDNRIIGPDRWLPCTRGLDPAVTTRDPIQPVEQCGYKYGQENLPTSKIPDQEKSAMLSRYLIRTSEQGRRQLSATSGRTRTGTKLQLDPDRANSTLREDPALLLPGDTFQSGSGTGIVDMATNGNLHAKRSNGEWRWASVGNERDPKVVAAMLDDDCRLKLVDDTGLTRLESRNFRRFGGSCVWETLPGDEAVFQIWSGNLPGGGNGDRALLTCGRGDQWALQGGSGEWTTPAHWARRCTVDSDADMEGDPMRHPDWFLDNPR